MNIIPNSLYYPLFTVFILILAMVLIPKDKFKDLFWYGLIWGLLVSCLFYLIFGKWIDLLDYELTKPFKFIEAPLWLYFAWIPTIMIFLYFLPSKEKPWYIFCLYLLAFGLSSAMLDIVFHEAGLLIYKGWNPFFRFLIAIFWFWGAKVHYIATEKPFQN